MCSQLVSAAPKWTNSNSYCKRKKKKKIKKWPFKDFCFYSFLKRKEVKNDREKTQGVDVKDDLLSRGCFLADMKQQDMWSKVLIF